MKNQNGFGSIVCLDKTGKKRRKPFAVRITTGWSGGKQVRKYIGYYETQTEALIALAEFHKNDVDVDLTKLTLNEVYDMWIQRIQKKENAAGIINMHKMAHSRFNKLGNLRFNKIKTVHLQDWLDNIDLKPSSKIKLKGTMLQLYKYAISNDIIHKNYAEGVEINEKVEQVGKLFTPAEISKLWELQDRKEARQLLILLYTGMRIGEMLIINRNDINFEEGYIIGGLKTDAGRNRVIPLHDDIIPLVKEQLGDNNWLIQSNRGVAMSYRNAANFINTLMSDLGMDHVIHDTRKTFVSWLHSEGIPMETIRIIVGHSGKGVTEKVYLKKEPKELVEIVNSIKIVK